MGELFRSFADSWAHFLERREPLESFVAGLPEDDGATVAVWLIPADPALAPGVAEVRERLRPIEWLRLVPEHFLHVTVAVLGFVEGDASVASAVDDARDRLRGLPPFRVSFPRLNCFHDAVVAEAEGDGLRDAAQRLGGTGEFFLPHVSVAYTAARGSPAELRHALVAMRDTHLGTQDVRAIDLCLVPASRTTILEPWTLAERIELGA